jgi:hypothetical protein
MKYLNYAVIEAMVGVLCYDKLVGGTFWAHDKPGYVQFVMWVSFAMAALCLLIQSLSWAIGNGK